MWMPGDEQRGRELKEQIIGGNIDRHPVGRKLTSTARDNAVKHAVDTWTANVGNGEAAQCGIDHVTVDVFKK